MSGPVYISKLEERNMEHRRRLNEIELFRQRAAEVHAKQQLLQGKNDAATAKKENSLLKKRSGRRAEEQLIAQNRANHKRETEQKKVLSHSLNKSMPDREYPLVDWLEDLISRLIQTLEMIQLDVKNQLLERTLCYREINQVTALLRVVQKALDLRDDALRHRLNEEDLKVLELINHDLAAILQEQRKVNEDLSKELSELLLKRPM